MAERFHGPNYKDTIKQIHSLQKPVGELTQLDIDNLVNSMLATPKHVLMSTLEAQLASDYWKTDRIDVPVLAIYPKNPMWPMWTDDYERFVRQLAPRVEYHVWEATSHLLNVERAADFNRLVQEFVRTVQDGQADSPSDGG